MVTLTLTEKGGEPKQLTFDKDEVSIGRVQGNDIVLPKGNVSKRHCRIVVSEGGVSIEDLKSTNGTYVNGRKIGEATALTGGDKIYVGDFVIRIDSAPGLESPLPSASIPGPEPGSLSTAIPRRPPPPPPPRSTTAMRTAPDEEVTGGPSARNRSSGRIAPPPPPPPPPKRESRPMAAFKDDDEEPPAPSDIDLDEDSLATQPPRLKVPPLKPVLSLSDDEIDKEEIITAARDRAPLPIGLGFSGADVDLPPWLARLFEPEDASAVFINGPQSIEVERGGRREPAALAPGDAAVLPDTLRALAAKGTPKPAADASLVSVTLPDGARLTVIFPPTAPQVCAAIARSPGGNKTLANLVTEGALSKEMQQILEACSGARRNVLVSGDRRAADVLLQALSNTITSRSRAVAIADRLSVPSNGAWTKLAAEPRQPELVAAAVSLRPDYLVVDVSSPTLAADVLHECALGQEGAFVALAARSAADALARLVALAGPALGSTASLRDLVSCSFDVVVHAATMTDGNVRVLEIAEPRLEDERLVAESLAAWRSEGEGAGKATGRFQLSSTPSRLASTLSARGVQVPAGVLRR